MSWLYYLLEANLYLCLFYAGYYLLFSRETYYAANRAYLLTVSVVAFIIPFLQLGYLKPVEQVTQMVFVDMPVTTVKILPATTKPEAFHITWQHVITAIYLLGVAVSLILFGIKIYKLWRVIGNNPTSVAGNYTLVQLDENNTAFSFFNYLFIGKNIPAVDTITRHELVHIKQKHSFDIIFMELIKAANWFNPLVYLLQTSLKTLHEYIADAQTATENNMLEYSTFLLNNAYGMQGLPPSHSFFNYNLLKKRIIMLNQKRSGSLAGLKYLLAVPLCGAMLCTSTLGFSKDYGLWDLLPNAKNEQNNGLNAALPNTPSNRESNVQPIKTTETNVPAGQTLINGAEKAASISDAFDELGSYIMKTAKYTEAARDNNIQGNVYIKFDIGTDHKISSAGLVKGLPYKCGENIIASLPSYPKTINVKPGTYYAEMTFVFMEQVDANNFKADAKKIQESEKDPVTPHFKTVIIVNKKGANNLSDAVKAEAKPDTGKIFGRMYSYGPGIDNLGSYVTKHTKYPETALAKQQVGNVVLRFKVNTDNSISDINVAESLGEEFDNNAIAALKSYPQSIKKTAGIYTLMVQFILMSADQSNVKGPGMPVLKADDKVLVSQIFGAMKTESDAPAKPVQTGKIKSDTTKRAPKIAASPQLNSAFAMHLSRNIKYPEQALNNKTVGTVNIHFNVDDSGAISDADIASGIGDGCDESTLKAVKSFDDNIKQKPGSYFVNVFFVLSADGKKPLMGPPVILKKPGKLLGGVTIIGFSKV